MAAGEWSFSTFFFVVVFQLLSRSTTSPSPPFSALVSVGGGGGGAGGGGGGQLKAPNLPFNLNCTDCSPQAILSNRIRKMQSMKRMKHRIMSAIRSNGIDLRRSGSAASGDGGFDSKAGEMAATQGLSRPGTSTPPFSSREGVTRVVTTPGKSGTPLVYDVINTTKTDSLSTSTGRTLTDMKASSATADGSVREEDPGSSSRLPTVALIRKSGPKIVSFSTVLSSGKKKHVLQFQLNPAVKGQDLEVVKAHLWLLLTRRRPHADRPEVKVNRKAKFKVTKGGANDNGTKVVSSKKGKRKRDVSAAEANSTVAVKDSDVKDDGLKVSRSRKKKRRKKKNRNGKPKADKESAVSASGNSSSFTNSTNEMEKKTVDGVDNKDDGDDDDDDNRPATTILRVVLVSENGTRTPMTYLRTKVKVTHWQKVRLPVSMIQQRLQSSNSTLTLLIRCGRCGRSVKMSLPKRTRSKGGKSKRRKRKRKRQRGGKEKKRRRTKRERRNRGDRQKKVRSNESKNNEDFRPSPFLVINTRMRTEKLV